jgi:hypothetical protein
MSTPTRPYRPGSITRAPTSAVSSPVTRLAGLSQGRSRITERSPITGFSQTSPTFMGLRSGGPFGVGVRHSRPSLASGTFGRQLFPNPIREEYPVIRAQSREALAIGY